MDRTLVLLFGRIKGRIVRHVIAVVKGSIKAVRDALGLAESVPHKVGGMSYQYRMLISPSLVKRSHIPSCPFGDGWALQMSINCS